MMRKIKLTDGGYPATLELTASPRRTLLSLTEDEDRDPQESSVLAALGYRDAPQASRWIDTLRSTHTYRRLSDEQCRLLEHLLTDVVTAIAPSPDPDAVLCLALDFLQHLCRWPGYFEFLLANPKVLRRLLALLAASPALSRFLLNNLQLLDNLLDNRNFRDLPDAAQLRATLASRLALCAGDEDAMMSVLRDVKHGHVLHILSLDLEGLLSIDEVSRALSDLAEVLLEAVLRCASEQLGIGPAPPLGIIGYGKLGSREMSYASDTDIVFVYDDRAKVGEKSLTHLARNVNRWLTLPTQAGVLYQTDFRLRPYGDSGLMITSLATYSRYLTHDAWIWEHQALTRARWIVGDGRLGEAFEAIRRKVLLCPREPGRLRNEVIAMRERIAAARGAADELNFDVKHSRGGIIDVEFIVQYVVLIHAAAHPVLAGHDDNVGTLERSSELGLVPPHLAVAAANAYRQYRRWLHSDRIRGIEAVRVSEQEAAEHRDAVIALWQQMICPA